MQVKVEVGKYGCDIRLTAETVEDAATLVAFKLNARSDRPRILTRASEGNVTTTVRLRVTRVQETFVPNGREPKGG